MTGDKGGGWNVCGATTSEKTPGKWDYDPAKATPAGIRSVEDTSEHALYNRKVG